MNTLTAVARTPVTPETDSLSLDALVQRGLPSVQRWAHGRLPRAARAQFDTRDLVQEAALRMLRRRGSFAPRHPGAVEEYSASDSVERHSGRGATPCQPTRVGGALGRTGVRADRAAAVHDQAGTTRSVREGSAGAPSERPPTRRRPRRRASERQRHRSRFRPMFVRSRRHGHHPCPRPVETEARRPEQELAHERQTPDPRLAAAVKRTCSALRPRDSLCRPIQGNPIRSLQDPTLIEARCSKRTIEVESHFDILKVNPRLQDLVAQTGVAL